jgi:hypothetical protein
MAQHNHTFPKIAREKSSEAPMPRFGLDLPHKFRFPGNQIGYQSGRGQRAGQAFAGRITQAWDRPQSAPVDRP